MSAPKSNNKKKVFTSKPVGKPVGKAVNKNLENKPSSDDASSSNDTPSPKNRLTMTRCASVKNANEKHSQCLFGAEGFMYCPLHQSQSNQIDFQDVVHEINQEILPWSSQAIDRTPVQLMPDKQPHNPVVWQLSLNSLKTNQTSATTDPNIDPDISSHAKTTYGKKKPPPGKGKTTTLKEQKTSTVVDNYNTEETDLEIKLLILVNDEEYTEKIPKMIGPVFNDVCLSEDEVDPITFDPIWRCLDGLTRLPASFNKYYLFSYLDSKGKIRCFTIFTLRELLESESVIHPITMDPIPPEAIKRGKKLVEIYSSKLGLFRDVDESSLSPEYKLKNRINKLFAKFHTHSIYLEDTWLMNLEDINDLYKIIRETGKLVTSNWGSIKPNSKLPMLFQWKRYSKAKAKNEKPDPTCGSSDPMEIKEYIVTQWEALITHTNDPRNQIPIWIIASGLSFVAPEVKQKYPDMEIMLS